MSPATRKLLDALGPFVAGRAEPSFTRRELRDATGFGDTQLKVHLGRLVDLEYVVANRCGPATTYELGRAEPGLRPDRSAQEAYRSAPGPDRSGNGRPHLAYRSAIGRPFDDEQKPPTTREDSSLSTDRPALRALRGTGGDGDAVVDVGTGR
jgi:DNA primase